MPPIAVATAAVAMDGIDPEVLRFVVVFLVGLALGGVVGAALMFRRLNPRIEWLLDLVDEAAPDNASLDALTRKVYQKKGYRICTAVEVPE